MHGRGVSCSKYCIFEIAAGERKLKKNDLVPQSNIQNASIKNTNLQADAFPAVGK